jgi:Fe(3+) dicitrate transport protein
LQHNYRVGKMESTLATGVRFATSKFDRKEEAPGTNKSDFDLTATGEYEEKYRFTTINIAAFIENCIRVNKRFSVTPGIRFESLESEAEAEYEVNGAEKETETEKERSFLLFGAGLQYKLAKTTSLYGNISQAYRPVDYAQLVPFGIVSKVDSGMKDPKGWNADVGIRGSIQNYFNYDISLFFLKYNYRIGLVNRTDESGNEYTLRTNTDQSIHRGIESYAELNITRAFGVNKRAGEFSIYNSFAYTRARYTKGIYKGHQAEYAPEIINRAGITYTKKAVAASLQFSNQSKAFSDAANTESSSNPVIGRIPGYSIIDWSVTISRNKLKFKGGISNLTDKRYFTQRTDEYPGPGIIPSAGRSFYVGAGYNL